ncbi:hypothetical protein [Pseudomonas sp. SWRI99]|uniref:hypothetical protein n=1 Tax=Pseudomonas sp. SWRI99 TaxID=2745506 RepID=UPI001646C6C3|nr:hypothetical protein [Pseudomonas sp. SWRI99]MBC3778171.1 hypothetical protein [Pseudomonas sp. SWRI99]
MFVDPETMLPYVPTPAYFLCGFDVYDREETLGEELEKYDPDSPADREILIFKYCLPVSRTCEQKLLLFKCLEAALLDSDYDFGSFFKYDYEACSSFPDGWDEMVSPRAFFEDIHRIIVIEWADDIQKANHES